MKKAINQKNSKKLTTLQNLVIFDINYTSHCISSEIKWLRNRVTKFWQFTKQMPRIIPESNFFY